MTSDQPTRIYIVYLIRYGFVRRKGKRDAVVESYHHPTPAAAWAAWKREASDRSVSLDAADYVVVGSRPTGEVYANGAHVVVLDWTDLHLAVHCEDP